MTTVYRGGKEAHEWAAICARRQKLWGSLGRGAFAIPGPVGCCCFSSYQKTWSVRNTPTSTQKSEYWAIRLLFGFMVILIFSRGEELCIFKVFLTGMKATAAVIFKLQWGCPWNRFVPDPWTLSEKPSVRNPLMEGYEWAVLCGVSFYPFFIFTSSSPWISSIPWTCGSHPFYELTEHPIVHLPPTSPEKEPPKFVSLTRCCDLSGYTGIITTGWRYLNVFRRWEKEERFKKAPCSLRFSSCLHLSIKVLVL